MASSWRGLPYGNRVRGTVDTSSLAYCCQRGPRPRPLPPCTPSGPRNCCPLALETPPVPAIVPQCQPAALSLQHSTPPEADRWQECARVGGESRMPCAIPGMWALTAGFDCAWQSQLSKAPLEGGHWLGRRSQEDSMNQVSGGTFVISWSSGSYILRM